MVMTWSVTDRYSLATSEVDHVEYSVTERGVRSWAAFELGNADEADALAAFIEAEFVAHVTRYNERCACWVATHRIVIDVTPTIHVMPVNEFGYFGVISMVGPSKPARRHPGFER